MANLDLSMLGSNTPQYSFSNFDPNTFKISGGNFGKEGLAGGDLAFQQQKYGQMANASKGFSADGTAGGNWMSKLNGIGSWGSMAGDALSSMGSAIGNKYGEDFSDDQKAAQSSIRKGLAMIPGYGQIIAAATGLVDAFGTVTGTNLSNLNKNSAKKAGAGFAAGFNNAMNMLPGNSMIWGLMGGRTDKYVVSEGAQELESGYAGTVGDMRAAGDLANKRVLFQRKKINNFISGAKDDDRLLTDLNETNVTRKNSDYYQNAMQQSTNRYAGQNYLGISVGKHGTKLMSIEEVRAIIMARHGKHNDPQKFQNGGTIGIDTNVLPEGALHARKNNLAELNPDLEDATKKGIPVMAADGGEIGEQVAEIENSEIIFRLDVTKRLEELRKDGSEEAMIEAGKLVAEELIENTQDNVGMITEEVQDGK